MTQVLVRVPGALCAVALLTAGLAACEEPSVAPIDQINLDRPVDIAFACFGSMRVTQEGSQKGQVIAAAQPISSCELRSGRQTPDADPAKQSPLDEIAVLREGQDIDVDGDGTIEDNADERPRPAWYSFILQSASGTVAIASWQVEPSDAVSRGEIFVVDGDPYTPGRNPISVGEDPVAIATDRSGCYAVVANAGSCDISVLEVSGAVDEDPATPVQVDRLAVTTAAGAIRSKPAAMIAEPSSTAIGNLCPVGPAGESTPAGIVYIAYPSCGVVAAVDTSSGVEGKVVAAIRFDAAGVATALTAAEIDALSCPDECSGAPPSTSVRPVALDLRFDDGVASGLAPSRRLVIGTSNSPLVTVVDLDERYLPRAMLPITQVALETPPGKPLGVTSVSLSPVIRMGGASGVRDDAEGALGGLGQYVYAVASDATVRVADVLRANPVECDTQVDGRLVRSIQSPAELACFPVGGMTTPRRRSGARSPGIELTEDSVPTSVAIFKGRRHSANAPAGTVVGHFAAITSSNGHSFVVNIDDDSSPDTFDPAMPQLTAPVRVMAHQLRDAITDRGAKGNCIKVNDNDAVTDPQLNIGGPRTTTPAARNLPGGTVGAERAAEMPGLRQFLCDGADATKVLLSELQFRTPDAPVKVRDRAFPDLRSAISQAWTVTWEGPLSADSDVVANDGVRVREGQMHVDSRGMRLVDEARPFCDIGVEPFDIVQFHGCDPANGDGDCPADFTCYVHPDSKVSGIGSCMRTSEAPRLANACRDYLLTNRRYTVDRADSRALTLLPRKHTLYATPLDGCVDDTQCNAIASEVAEYNPAADPYVARTPDQPQASFTHWRCEVDPARAPIDADPARNKRCVQTCGFHLGGDANMGQPGYDGLDRDTDCATGTICVGATPVPPGGDPLAHRGVCMEGVTPPPVCVAGPQRFDVRASEAFTMIGARSGYVHPIIAGPDGVCMRDPAADRLQVGRIPLEAPACPPDSEYADRATGALVGGGFAPNPCSLRLPQTESVRVYDPESGSACVVTGEAIVEREADMIEFSNSAMTFHLVDPTYPGNLTCPQDRDGGFERVSMIVPGASPLALGYQLAFAVGAGFEPQRLTAVPSHPVKVVRGPNESLWLVDDGDTLSQSVGAPSLRGQVLRVDPLELNNESVVIR